MNTFETRVEDGEHRLYINGNRVLRAWESFTGWFWFATEKVREQESDFGDGRPVADTIWFGFVQGQFEEWGNFSEAEIKMLGNRAWEIEQVDLPFAGRRASDE